MSLDTKKIPTDIKIGTLMILSAEVSCVATQRNGVIITEGYTPTEKAWFLIKASYIRVSRAQSPCEMDMLILYDGTVYLRVAGNPMDRWINKTGDKNPDPEPLTTMPGFNIPTARCRRVLDKAVAKFLESLNV